MINSEIYIYIYIYQRQICIGDDEAYMFYIQLSTDQGSLKKIEKYKKENKLKQ